MNKCIRIKNYGNAIQKVFYNTQVVSTDSMKDSEQSSREIILEEQNYIVKAFKELKDSIFNVLFVILDKEDNEEDDQSMLSLAFQSGVDYLQMFAFPFDAAVIVAWNGGDTLQKVAELFSRFNITSYLPGVSFNTFLILLYLLILLIVLVLIDIIYVSYSFTKKKFKFTWPLVILAQLVPLFVTILFLPITQILLSVVRCETDETKNYQVMVSFPDIACWQGWHLFHSAITLLFASLFIFISSIVSLALFEPRMTSKKLTARQNSRGQVIFIMNKIICQLIFSFTPFKETWVYSIMLFALSGWLYWTYNMNDPFYNKKVSVFFRVLSSYYFWTNFMLLASVALEGTGFNGAFIVWISGLPFIGLLIAYEKKSDIDQLFNSNLSFKSGFDLEKHISYVLRLIQNKENDKNAYMLITGYIQKHKQICMEEDCPLKTMAKTKKKKNNDEQFEFKLLKKIEKMYQTGVKKFPYCTQLRLSFAFFNLQRLKNKNKAYEEFSYAQKFNPKFQEEFIIYRFRKIIRENLQNNKDDNTDLIELIRFDNHILLCEEAMILSAHLHKQFWTELKEDTPNLKKLNEIGSKITKAGNAVKQNYEEIFKINSSVPEVLYAYAVYLILVIKDVKEGKQLMEFSKKIYVQNIRHDEKSNENSEFNGNLDTIGKDVPIIQISSKMTTFGKITNTNNIFTDLTGFKKQELLDRPLEKILPQILASTHEQAIHNFVNSEINSKQSNYLMKQNIGYIRIKSGHVVPVEYSVAYKPLVEKFYAIFSTSQSITKNICHILVNESGIIKDISRLGTQFFGLQKKDLVLNCEEIENLGIQSVEILYEEMGHLKKDGYLERKIKFLGGNSYLCQVRVEAVKMKIVEPCDMDEEDEGMFKPQESIVGYYIKIENKDYQRGQEIVASSISGIEEIQQFNQQQPINVLDLYEQPNEFEMMIRDMIQAKTKFETFQPFVLKTKIKTMRLVNNQIKMAYDKDNFNEHHTNNEIPDEEEDYDFVKLNDENYHSKIRAAINTKLDHQEVGRLKIATLLALIALVISNTICLDNLLSIYNSVITESELYCQKIKAYQDVAKFLNPTFFGAEDYKKIANQISEYNLTYLTNQSIPITTFYGQNIQKSITDGIRYELSNLANYYMLMSEEDEQLDVNVKNKFIDNIYLNYLQNLYPSMKNSSLPTMQFMSNMGNFFKTIVQILPGIFIPILIFYIFWTYIRLKIDQKKVNILLWFLDIPISYIVLLRENCDYYLKNFISVKELMKKGINQNETEYSDEEQKSDKYFESGDLVEEEEKARKSLIHKERKKGICSNLKIGYLKTFWVIIITNLFAIVGFSVSLYYQQTLNFMTFPYLKMGEQITNLHHVIFSSSVIQSQGKFSNQPFVIDSHRQALEFFQNYQTQEEIMNYNFRTIGYELNQNLIYGLRNYTVVLFSDLCKYLEQQTTECGLIAGSSLKGSFRIYSMYLIDEKNYGSYPKLKELSIANEKYVTKALYQVLQIWKEILYNQSIRSISITETAFYVFIFVGTLIPTFFWFAYLMKVNEEINESIKMLNMIPFKLLSRSRKETREFIVWLIREANHKIHSSQ